MSGQITFAALGIGAGAAIGAGTAALTNSTVRNAPDAEALNKKLTLGAAISSGIGLAAGVALLLASAHARDGGVTHMVLGGLALFGGLGAAGFAGGSAGVDALNIGRSD